jgi:hypothetical protein
MSNTPAPQVEIQLPELPELPLIQRWRTTGWGSSGIIEDSEGEYVDHDDHVAAMRAYAQAALNARACGDVPWELLEGCRNLLNLVRTEIRNDKPKVYACIKSRDGSFVDVTDTIAAIDAALASQAVGVKDGR